MRPSLLKTKLFLDSGDPKETVEVVKLLGFLDGQTTNPTLIAKNPRVKEQIAKGKKYSKQEIYDLYQDVVKEVSSLIPDGSVSIEVYADEKTKSEEMLTEGKKMFSWIPNAHIKYPTNHEGLKAAQESVKNHLRVNMTLVFSQEQAAAVYAATKGAKKGDIFVSPFIGRLDDRGENGMDLIRNTLKMYEQGDGHVEVLTASVRNFAHFMEALKLGTDIITAPLKVYEEWALKGMPIPEGNFEYKPLDLAPIQYEAIDLQKKWQDYEIHHALTDAGIQKFKSDWNALIM